MSNQATNSSKRGFLAPVKVQFLAGQDLRRFLQQLVVGITNLPGELVRPRWQSEMPNQPPLDASWAAIGKLTWAPDTYAYEAHQGNQEDVLVRHEELELMASFYGPDADLNAETFHLGLQLAQNREYLTRAGYGLKDADTPRVVPYKLNELWIYGVDVQFTLKRSVGSTYAVEDVASVTGELVVDEPPITRSLS